MFCLCSRMCASRGESGTKAGAKQNGTEWYRMERNGTERNGTEGNISSTSNVSSSGCRPLHKLLAGFRSFQQEDALRMFLITEVRCTSD